MFCRSFTIFTTFSIVLTFWQLSEVWRRTGKSKTRDAIWFKEGWKNAFLTEFSYLLWMQLQFGAVLYIQSTVISKNFINFMDEFPRMQSLLANLAMNTAFFNNLVVFMATLARYKLLSQPNKENVLIFSIPLVTSGLIVYKIFDCFFRAYDGKMCSSFLLLLFG